MRNDLALITVVYENYDVLEDFFQSIKEQTDKTLHVFIADASKNRQDIPKQDFPMTVIPIKNLGYAHGVNECLKKALNEDFSYFVVINSDTTLRDDFVHEVLESFQREPERLYGGKIYYYPGFEYHKDRYQKQDRGNVFWYAGGLVDWKNVFTSHRGVDEIDKGQYDKLEETEFITGCLLAFDKEALDRIGLWDEKYFLYYEDADFCERAKRKGIQLMYNPDIVMWHKNAQSTGGSGSKIHQKYQRTNRVRFGLKYAPWRTKLHLLKNFAVESFSGK